MKKFQQRSAAVAEPPQRTMRSRAMTLSEDDRSFEAVVTSEQPVPMIDYRTGDMIEEVLLADGIEFRSPSIPLLDSHQRDSTQDVVGSMTDFRSEGTLTVGRGSVAFDDARADSIWAKIRDGHLTSLSIGYTAADFVDISPGQTQTIGGRLFTAGPDTTLRIVTRTIIHEVSIVAIPADPNAIIREAQFATQTRSISTMPASHHSRSTISGPTPLPVLIAGQLLRNGINDPTRHGISEQHADRGVSWSTGRLLAIVAEAARLDGLRFDIETQALDMIRQRGMSTSSAVGQLFTSIFGALFQDGFDATTDTTAGWTSEADNLTLKRTPRTRPSNLTPLKKRGVGATAEHVEFEAVSEDTRLGEYTGLFEVDQQDIINDQFGALDQTTPRMMGEAAARLRLDLVYSVLLANAAMRDGTALFHADHANLLVTSSLGDTTLESAVAAIATQTERGAPLNLRGRYLIVPQALERTAASLVRAAELADSSATQPPVVRSDSRLDNGVTDPATSTTHSGSASTWYLATQGANTIEVQYLAGANRLPEIRSGFLNKGQFGVWFDVSHWIGAKAIDWRGLVKCIA